ncbi:SRPBCC domain-containing protein, partial [Alphaproteobacteria bacterium]|nr:SRPBCC domain-containing protein [Alphaproteobacteria bacterium]
TPSPFTPLGAKGAAEGNCMSTPVCLANAVCDALDIDNVVVPLTPAKISALLHGEEKPCPAGDQVGEPADAGSALTGAGETFIPAAPVEVWLTMLDPAALAAVIPGCHGLDLVGENSYRAEVSLGVGPVRGRFVANVALSDLVAPSSATLSGGLIGSLGASQGGGHVTLTEDGQGTRITYDYQVEISGKVAAIGGRMLEGAAKIVVGQFFTRLTAQISGEAMNETSSSSASSWWQRLFAAFGIK